MIRLCCGQMKNYYEMERDKYLIFVQEFFVWGGVKVSGE